MNTCLRRITPLRFVCFATVDNSQVKYLCIYPLFKYSVDKNCADTYHMLVK